MPNTPPPVVVFSDLDGTLLDHRSYSAEAARPALARLAALGAPVILSSSKTAAEMGPLRRALGLERWPAIVENGAGVLEAGRAADRPAATEYLRLRGALARLPPHLRTPFRGFGDMSMGAIARATGLPAGEVPAAADRGHSEPGLWQGSEARRSEFIAALAEMGVTAREGGRFLTLSFGGTKADRMPGLAARFGTPLTLALGDAPNDREMIEAADIGVIVANPHGKGLPPLAGEAQGRIRRTRLSGPAGWNEAVQAILNEQGL